MVSPSSIKSAAYFAILCLFSLLSELLFSKLISFNSGLSSISLAPP
ncbi:hypothetical protein [Clostridium butyricum]